MSIIQQKVTKVRLTTVESILEFDIFPTTTGQVLFDQTAETIGLKEKRLFGIQYVDKNGQRDWLRLSEKVLSHDLLPENPVQLKFRVKHFPEDVEAEAILLVTKRLLYYQVQEAILNDEIYCPPEVAALLASYACQVRHGRRTIPTLTPEKLASERLLPDRVLQHFKLSPHLLATRITLWWSEHGSMLPMDACVEYVKVAQDLEMYGVTYFDIRNERGSPLLLGIDSLGINIYNPADKLTPKIGFGWTDMYGISRDKKMLTIKSGGKDGAKPTSLSMSTSHEHVAKRIITLSLENYQLYFTRRQPESEELKQLKEQAKEERKLFELKREREEEMWSKYTAERLRKSEQASQMPGEQEGQHDTVEAARHLGHTDRTSDNHNHNYNYNYNYNYDYSNSNGFGYSYNFPVTFTATEYSSMQTPSQF